MHQSIPIALADDRSRSTPILDRRTSARHGQATIVSRRTRRVVFNLFNQRLEAQSLLENHTLEPIALRVVAKQTSLWKFVAMFTMTKAKK